MAACNLSTDFFQSNFDNHMRVFLERLEYPLTYEFHIVLNVRTDRGERIHRIQLNKSASGVGSFFVPLLQLKAQEQTLRKVMTGISDIGNLYASGEILASGELYLLGAISNALKNYYRNACGAVIDG